MGILELLKEITLHWAPVAISYKTGIPFEGSVIDQSVFSFLFWLMYTEFWLLNFLSKCGQKILKWFFCLNIQTDLFCSTYSNNLLIQIDSNGHAKACLFIFNYAIKCSWCKWFIFDCVTDFIFEYFLEPFVVDCIKRFFLNWINLNLKCEILVSLKIQNFPILLILLSLL